jgi:hypothetical protein
MDGTAIAPTQRSQAQQVIDRLTAELRFDDGAYEQRVPEQGSLAQARAEGAEWITLVASLMPSRPALKTPAVPGLAVPANSPRRASATPIFAAARSGDGASLLEIVERDSVQYGRFSDGAELEYQGLDGRGRPVFLGPRASIRELAANFLLTIAGLGLGVGVFANLHAILGFGSAFLSSIMPTIVPPLHL